MEYLEYVIKAIEPFSDKIMIFYTEKPSHNHDAGVPCPENRDELYQLAHDSSNKIDWHDVDVFGEGNHRQQVFKYSDGYDLVLNADSDEVWDQEFLAKCLEESINVDSRFIGVYGFINFYRSFNWVVSDFFYPIRIHNLKSNNKEHKTVNGKIYHFGYCQRWDTFNYKLKIHGHRAEFKNNWIVDKYLNFDPKVTKKMHPCSEDVWLYAEPFDKTTLPEMLKTHPYYNLEKI
jgi:hypothetical protein